MFEVLLAIPVLIRARNMDWHRLVDSYFAALGQVDGPSGGTAMLGGATNAYFCRSLLTAGQSIEPAYVLSWKLSFKSNSMSKNIGAGWTQSAIFEPSIVMFWSGLTRSNGPAPPR